ncbi:UNVERIFIED_CONTAM: hypothetical protein K2H54_053846 [Gekko kuhli]
MYTAGISCNCRTPSPECSPRLAAQGTGPDEEACRGTAGMLEEGGEIGSCPGSSSLCSYYGRAARPPISKMQMQPEVRVAATAVEGLGGTSLGKQELLPPPSATD